MFDPTGILRIESAFSADDAARMRDVMWGELRQRYAIDRDDPSTWNNHLPTGLKNAKKHRAFGAILGAPLRAALDEMFGAGEWAEPKQFGQVQITMPNAEAWHVPHHLWHADFDYYLNPAHVVKVWALVDDLEPGGGGTLQLAGSHLLAAKFIEGKILDEREYKRVRDGIMRSDPWLKELSTESDDPGRTIRFMRHGTVIDGIELRVVELAGNAGDVFVTHPWVMHCIASNANARPRMMRSFAIMRKPPE